MKFLVLVVLMTAAQAAFADPEGAGYMTGVYIANPDLYDKFIQAAPGWLVALVPMLVSLMVGLRALSSALFWVSRFIPKSRAAWQILNTVLRYLALALGYIGVGMPKDMVMEKAEAEAKKELGSQA